MWEVVTCHGLGCSTPLIIDDVDFLNILVWFYKRAEHEEYELIFPCGF